jgi:hypothetical protein
MGAGVEAGTNQAAFLDAPFEDSGPMKTQVAAAVNT